MIRLLLVCAVALLLAGCGGGGGGGGPSSTPPLPPTPRSEPPVYMYFGVQRREGKSDIEETAEHVSALYLMDWGDWDTPQGRTAIADQIIADLQEGRAHGIGRAIVACGFEMFTRAYDYRGNGTLQLFRQRISDLGLLSMVVGISLVDEPDMRDKGPISDATMTTAFADAHAAWPEARIAVVYGDGGTFPGISAARLVGRDMYDKGAGVLSYLPPITAEQQYLLVPGGCDPYRNDPAPFVTFAKAHAQVYGICAFRWFDHASGAGIRSNGMAQAYRAAGLSARTAV